MIDGYGQRISLAILSGVLQILIFPTPSVSSLSWVALVPMLLAVAMPAAKRLPTSVQSFLLASLAGVVWYGGSCYWVYHVPYTYGHHSKITSAALLLLFSLFLAMHHGAFGFILGLLARSRRVGPIRALVISPLLWVTVELARARLTGFPWDLLGYTQVDNVPLARVATWTGVFGLSFVVASVNVLIAIAFVLPKSRRAVLLVASLGLAILLQAGTLVSFPALAANRRGLLVQQNLPILDAGWTEDYFDKTMDALITLSSEVRSGSMHVEQPHLIVWPESPAPFYTNDPKFRQSLSSLAVRTNSYFIAGSLGTTSNGSAEKARIFNSAVLITPQAQFAARYDKIHLVPFGEYVPAARFLRFAHKLTRDAGDFSRGKTRLALPIGDQHTVAVFICYESIFPDEVRQFTAAGSELFVNISNDGWFGESGAPRQHLNMARMRAIENNRWLLRATNTGITASIDPYGRIISHADRNVRTALVVPYAFIAGENVYSRYGDWFAFACLTLTLMAVAISQLPKVSRR